VKLRRQTAVDGALWLWSTTLLGTLLTISVLAATVEFFIVSADIERHGPLKAQLLIEKHLMPHASLVITSSPTRKHSKDQALTEKELSSFAMRTNKYDTT
jgi:hypothetical protein